MSDAEQPILFGSATSPFVRKVRLCLHAKAIPHRFQPMSSWRADSGIEQMNPLAKVPVLRTASGEDMFDSRVIAQYLDIAYPAVPLLPPDGMARIAALRIEALADGIADATALCVQEGWRKAPSESWRARQQAKVAQGLPVLEQAWADQAVQEADAAPSLAGIATASTIGFVRFWLPDVLAALAMPACARVEAALATHDWFDATRPVVAPGTAFPSF